MTAEIPMARVRFTALVEQFQGSDGRVYPADRPRYAIGDEDLVPQDNARVLFFRGGAEEAPVSMAPSTPTEGFTTAAKLKEQGDRLTAIRQERAVARVEAEGVVPVKEPITAELAPGVNDSLPELTLEDEGRELERLRIVEEERKRAARLVRLCAGFTGTDDGNALRFVKWHGENVRYDHTAKRWLIWDGVRWRPDEEGRIREMAREVARRIPDEARSLHEKEAETRLKWAASSLEAHRLAHMLELAQSDRVVAITGKVLDTNPYLMGLPNGTLDLRTGELITPPRKEDLITRIAGVPLTHGATCPVWEDHIRKVSNGDPELIKYLQVALGYSLLGTNPEMAFNVVWGKGKNGKSVTFRAVKDLLGDYAMTSDPSTFEAQKYERETRDDVVRLRGARLVVSFESQKGRRLAENQIKAWTGGDEIVKRGTYDKPLSFTLPIKIFLCTNYKPQVRDFSTGWWERLKMIPFIHYFPPEERDKDIDTKLKAEGPGILLWLLAGLREYLIRGIPPCRAVDAAIKEFKEAQEGDVGQWLHEMCVEEEGATLTRKNARTGFLEWCKNGDEEKEAMSVQDFKRELEDRGFGEKKVKGTWYWVGFRFKTEEEMGRQATLSPGGGKWIIEEPDGESRISLGKPPIKEGEEGEDNP